VNKAIRRGLHFQKGQFILQYFLKVHSDSCWSQSQLFCWFSSTFSPLKAQRQLPWRLSLFVMMTGELRQNCGARALRVGETVRKGKEETWEGLDTKECSCSKE